MRNQIALFQEVISQYAPTLNENTNDRYLSPIQKIDLIGRRTSQALSTTSQSHMEPIWDRIKNKSKYPSPDFSTLSILLTADILLLLQTGINDLMRKAQIFLYANGKDQPPTAIDLDKTLLKDLLFNQSTSKVCFLHIQNCINLNFDGSRIESKSASRWIIRDSNDIIKMSACRYLSKVSIIITEYMTFRCQEQWFFKLRN